MATEKVSSSRIQVKHILIGLIGTITAILFIASIVLITIGYLNPFGSVGLGILGGGCVVFFSAVLFLCASSIWIKNKYYGDETDYKKKLVGRSSEDITLLKPTSPIFSSEHLEAGCGKNDFPGDNYNPVPLYSVSTIYSSVSSSSSINPGKMFPHNCQEEDIAAALDSDVFSSSLTALQHGDIRAQQKLEPTKCSTEMLIAGYTGQKVENQLKNQHAIRTTNQIYVSDLPRQRRPLVMESPYLVPHVNSDKLVENPLTDVKSAKAKETHPSTNRDLCEKNLQLWPMDTSKIPATTPQHKASSSHEKDGMPDQRNKNNVKSNPQTADRWGPSIPQSHRPIGNTTRATKQGITTIDVITAIAGNLKKKQNYNEETDTCKQARTAIPLQGLSSQSQLDQSTNVQVCSPITKAELPREKVLITQKQVKPGNRTNQM